MKAEPPMDWASVSVMRNRSCFEENVRSAWRNMLLTPDVVHGVTGGSSWVASRWSCIA